MWRILRDARHGLLTEGGIGEQVAGRPEAPRLRAAGSTGARYSECFDAGPYRWPAKRRRLPAPRLRVNGGPPRASWRDRGEQGSAPGLPGDSDAGLQGAGVGPTSDTTAEEPKGDEEEAEATEALVIARRTVRAVPAHRAVREAEDAGGEVKDAADRDVKGSIWTRAVPAHRAVRECDAPTLIEDAAHTVVGWVTLALFSLTTL